MSYDLTEFCREIQELGILPEDKLKKQFIKFYEMLAEWNHVMNLTAIIEFEEVLKKHFLDSLCLVKALPHLDNQTILDLGTGAGFPGIPLKIAFSGLRMTLLDSLNKRVRFLGEVIRELELSDICAIHGRAEEMARKRDYRQKFDVCVSRAVANLSTLTEYCLPFVKEGGYFVAYKSAEADGEIERSGKVIALLGGELHDVVKFTLPDSDLGRSLVCVRKVRETPEGYPRKAGIPVKKPIL